MVCTQHLYVKFQTFPGMRNSLIFPGFRACVIEKVRCNVWPVGSGDSRCALYTGGKMRAARYRRRPSGTIPGRMTRRPDSDILHRSTHAVNVALPHTHTHTHTVLSLPVPHLKRKNIINNHKRTNTSYYSIKSKNAHKHSIKLRPVPCYFDMGHIFQNTL